MVSVLLYAAVAIALAAGAGFALLTLFENSAQMRTGIETVSRIDVAVGLLYRAARLDPQTGLLTLPYGFAHTSTGVEPYLTLPAQLGLPVAAFDGVPPLRYCPFGPRVAAPGETATPMPGAGETYSVVRADYAATLPASSRFATASTFTVDGTLETADYVVAGSRDFATILPNLPEALAQELAAVIVAAGNESEVPPNCSDVVSAGNRNLRICDTAGPTCSGRGGTARAVWAAGAHALAARAAGARLTVFADDGAARRPPWGLSVNDPMPLRQALAFWQSARPRHMDIVLMSSDRADNDLRADAELTDDLDPATDQMDLFHAGLSLRAIDPASPAAVEIGIGTLASPGDLALQSIALVDGGGDRSGTIRVQPGQTARLERVSGDVLWIIGGLVTIHGTDNAFNTVRIDGGALRLMPDAALSVDRELTVRGGRLVLEGDPEPGVGIDDGALLTLRNNTAPRIANGATLIIQDGAVVELRDSVAMPAYLRVSAGAAVLVQGGGIWAGDGSIIQTAVSLASGSSLYMGGGGQIGRAGNRVGLGIDALGARGVFGRENDAEIFATSSPCVASPASDFDSIDPAVLRAGMRVIQGATWMNPLDGSTAARSIDSVDLVTGVDAPENSFWHDRRDDADASPQCPLGLLGGPADFGRINDNQRCLMAWMEAIMDTSADLHRYALASRGSVGVIDPDSPDDWCQ